MKWLRYVKWLIVALVLIFLVLAVINLDMQSLLDGLRQIPVWAVAVLFGVQIITQLLINVQWHQIAKVFGSPLGFMRMLFINAQAEMIHVAPAGHIGCDVFRAVQINKAGSITGEQAAAVVAIQKLFSLTAFFTISITSITLFIGRVEWLQGAGFRFLLYGILLSILLLLICVFIMPHKLAQFMRKREKKPRFKWTEKLRGFLLVSLGQAALIRSNRKLRLKLFVIAFTIWLVYPLKLYLLAFQIMPEINIIYITAATFLSYTVAMIPIFPAGLGGFEGTMVGLLLLIGFLQSDALVITVIFRFATFWFVVLMSLVYMAVYKFAIPLHWKSTP